MWLAPNLMTLAGFLLLVMQTGVLAYYDPYFVAVYTENAIPVWIWILSMLAQFLSHTLGM